MTWLETIGVFLLGWFGKKLKRFAEATLDTVWLLLWCTPARRCYCFIRLFDKYLGLLCADLDAGRLRERERQAYLLLASWIDPRLKAWQRRVRPGERPESGEDLAPAPEGWRHGERPPWPVAPWGTAPTGSPLRGAVDLGGGHLSKAREGLRAPLLSPSGRPHAFGSTKYM